MNKSGSEILVYEAADGEVRVDVRLEHGTVWLNQQQMAELFGRERSVITRHVRSVFREGELDEKSNVHFLHIAGSDRPVGFYNLDVIISVGYRVKSRRGTQFRIWATRTLREHLVQGYTLNRPRLARGAGLRRAGAGRSAVRNLGGGMRPRAQASGISPSAASSWSGFLPRCTASWPFRPRSRASVSIGWCRASLRDRSCACGCSTLSR